MHRIAPTALLLVVLLAGCGGGAEKPSAKLPVLAEKDLTGVTFDQGPAFAVKTPEDLARVDGDESEVAALERDGFRSARAVKFAIGPGRGYSTTTRFRNAAAAQRELRQSIRPGEKGTTLHRGAVAGVPNGVSATYRSKDILCRNVYSSTGDTVSFIGFCISGKAGDPGEPAMEAALKAVLARA